MGYNLLKNGVYWGYKALILALTIDPNFRRDIQVYDGSMKYWLVHNEILTTGNPPISYFIPYVQQITRVN